MTFVTMLFVIGGLMLIFSGIENKSIGAYAQEWLGTAKNG